MKANLVLFNTEEEEISFFPNKYNLLKRKLNNLTVELVSTTVFCDYNDFISNLHNSLLNFTIIGANLDNFDFINTIRPILIRRYNTELIKCEIGYLIKNSNNLCLIINLSNDNYLDLLEFNKMAQILPINRPCATLNVFGLEKSEIQKQLLKIPNNMNFSFSIYTHYLASEIKIIPNNNIPKEVIDDFVRNVYIQFENYWYGDNDDTLFSKLAEIAMVRRVKICIADGLTNGLFEEYVRQYIPNYNGIGCIYNVKTLEDYAKVLHVNTEFLATHEKYSVEMAYEMSAVMMENNMGEISISICGNTKSCFISVGDKQAIHVFKYSFDHNEEYIHNIMIRQAIFKLLKKLRENQLCFLENDV